MMTALAGNYDTKPDGASSVDFVTQGDNKGIPLVDFLLFAIFGIYRNHTENFGMPGVLFLAQKNRAYHGSRSIFSNTASLLLIPVKSLSPPIP